jgi:hypothetical protein
MCALGGGSADGAIVGLLLAMLRVSERRLDHERLPEGNGKRALLRAIERASRALPLSAALRVARLSASRYHAWRRAEVRCELDDRSSAAYRITEPDRAMCA